MFRAKKSGNNVTIRSIGIFSWSLIGLIIILAGIFYVLSLMKVAIIPGIIGIFIAYMLIPLVNLFRKKMKKIWAVAVTYIIFLAIIFVLFFFIIPLVFGEFRSVITKLPSYVHEFSIFINNLIADNPFIKNLESVIGINFLPGSSLEVTKFFVNNFNLEGFNIFQSATSLTKVIFNVVLNFVIGPVLGFYLLKDSENFIIIFLKVIPARRKHTAISIINRIDNVFENYIRGQLIKALIIAVLATIGMMLLKVEFSTLLGVLTFFFSLIPVIGPIIPIIPAAISALLTSPLKALLVIIIFIGIYIVNHFFISPHIIKNKTAMHPGLVLFSLIAGAALFGWLGIFLAVPVVAVIQEIIRYYVIDKKMTNL